MSWHPQDHAVLTGILALAFRLSATRPVEETGLRVEGGGSLPGHRSLTTTTRYLAQLEGQVITDGRRAPVVCPIPVHMDGALRS